MLVTFSRKEEEDAYETKISAAGKFNYHLPLSRYFYGMASAEEVRFANVVFRFRRDKERTLQQ